MKKIMTNFIYQSIYQLASIILPIITIPIVSRALGPEGIGTWNYMQSIMNYFLLLAGLGLANYGVREIAIVRDNKDKLSIKFWELALFNFFFSIITLTAYLIVSMCLKNTNLYLIQSLVLIGALFDITWFYSGTEDFKKISFTGVLIKFIGFIFTFLFIKNQNDLPKYVFIQSISILLNQLVLWLFMINKVKIKKISIKKIFSHFFPALRFFISKIAMTIYLNLNKTILGYMTTMTVVGYYSNALTLVTLSGSLITSLNTVLIPTMSNTYISGDEQSLIKRLEKSLHFQLFLTIPLSFGIMLVNEKMINWFFGSEFEFIVKIVPLLAPVVIVQSLQSGIAAQYLIPKNDMKSYNLTVVIGAVISVICNIVAIPIMGIYGAVLATIAGQTTLCIVRSYTLIKETSFRYNMKLIIQYFVCSLLMFVIGGIITKNMISSMMTTFAQIVIGMGIYFLFTMILKINPIYNLIISKRKFK